MMSPGRGPRRHGAGMPSTQGTGPWDHGPAAQWLWQSTGQEENRPHGDNSHGAHHEKGNNNDKGRASEPPSFCQSNVKPYP